MIDKVIWLFDSPQEFDFEYDPEDNEQEAEMPAPREFLLDSRRLILYGFATIDEFELQGDEVFDEMPLEPSGLDKQFSELVGCDQEILTLNSRGKVYNYEIEDFKTEHRLEEEQLKLDLVEQADEEGTAAGLGFLWLPVLFPEIRLKKQ